MGQEGTVRVGASGPMQVSRLRTPVIFWRLKQENGGKVETVKLLIDGNESPIVYDPERSMAKSQLAAPLSPGEHQVVVEFTVPGGEGRRRRWTLTVPDDAGESIPAIGDTARQVMLECNEIRRRLNLPEYRIDPALCAAAAAHTQYLNHNKSTGHKQRDDLPLFVGNFATERAQAYGYMDNVSEVLSAGFRSMPESVRKIFDAPYHRARFMFPGSLPFGAAFEGDKLAINMGAPTESGTVISPGAGETGVPVLWRDQERPDPLILWAADGARRPVGYPIVFTHSTPDLVNGMAGEACIKLEYAALKELSADGQAALDVPLLINVPHKGGPGRYDSYLRQETPYAAVMFPKAPLRQLTKYEVSLIAKTHLGESIERTWTFTTGDK
ncbi:MAG: hypothetical protein HONBIEJF_02196 [Fimbriimonadaceae bacterium]|nr:hypothetical protein [Fimbriimonadaceae bacterium]